MPGRARRGKAGCLNSAVTQHTPGGRDREPYTRQDGRDRENATSHNLKQNTQAATVTNNNAKTNEAQATTRLTRKTQLKAGKQGQNWEFAQEALPHPRF